jgi:serine/threonine protein kinase
MGICLPKENNPIIISAYDKSSLGKLSLSRYSTNFTGVKLNKSTKNLSNSDSKLSKVTKYDDINKYYILSQEKISQGGSGIVYMGKKIDSNSKKYEYAIKQVFKKNDQLNVSLIKEIEINSIIHHNNIVKCFEIFEDGLSVYFVFELMPDGDLFDYIISKPNHRLKDKEIINLLEQILLALIYLHEKIKVVHRDIKPENFMIKKGTNEGVTIKLMDFGTSDFITEEGFNYISQGTPLYIAPEVYLDQKYDAKIDMWETGVVLYNMTTGNHPFKNNNDNLENSRIKNIDLDNSNMDEDKKIMNNVLNKELDFNVFKNYGLRLLAQKLLEKDPNNRYSAVEAFDELSGIKRGINMNKRVAKTINESPKKLMKNPIVFESSNEKEKYLAKSSFNHKFKGIFKFRVSEIKGEEEEEKIDENPLEKDKNKKKDNEIRILIKKKKNK